MPEPVYRVWPPPAPSLRAEPWPPGTLVTGYTQSGLYVSPEHRQHLFKLGEAYQDVEFTNAGWQQDAWCVVCDVRIRCDGEFLMVRVDEERLAKFTEYCGVQARRFHKAAAEVVQQWQPVTR